MRTFAETKEGLSMPTYEEFGKHVAAHLSYLHALPLADALDGLRRRLLDESWREAAGDWVERLRAIEQYEHLEGDRRVRGLWTALVDELVKLGIDREAHEILHVLLVNVFHASGPEASRLIEWFVSRAGPGDVSLGAEVVEWVLKLHKPDCQGSLQVLPIAEWLLQNGSAELRSKRRLTLVEDVSRALLAHGADRSSIGRALRYVFLNEDKQGSQGRTSDRQEAILPVVEHLVDGDPRLGADLILASTDAHGRWILQRVLDPMPAEIAYPRLRGALLDALIRDRLPAPVAADAWGAAFWTPCPVPLPAFRSAEGVARAAEVLHRHGQSRPRWNPALRGRVETDVATNELDWARFIVSEYVRIHDLCGAGSPSAVVTEGVRRVAIHRRTLAAGAHKALSRALAGNTSPRFELARAILRDGGPSPRVIDAVFRVLPPASPATSRADADLAELHAAFVQIVQHPWLDPVRGVDVARLLGSAKRVELTQLDQERKVLVRGDALLLDERSLRQAIDDASDREVRLVRGVTYVFHELLHVRQGIGEKEAVTRLRNAGAETTVMHMDLEADHTAALLTQEAVPRWPLTWIKDQQGHSLVAFPAGAMHSMAARARKAHRLVGLRVDYLIRAGRMGPTEPSAEGYYFADFGPAGGSFLVLTSGPPITLFSAGALEGSDAAALSGAVDSADELRGMDDILERCLRAARSGG
jgi:hypothetical protein